MAACRSGHRRWERDIRKGSKGGGGRVVKQDQSANVLMRTSLLPSFPLVKALRGHRTKEGEERTARASGETPSSISATQLVSVGRSRAVPRRLEIASTTAQSPATWPSQRCQPKGKAKASIYHGVKRTVEGLFGDHCIWRSSIYTP